MERNAKRGSEGFTLIEVGVAVALFSIVLVAAGGMLSAISTGNAHTQVKTTGTFHMQRQVEQLYETDYDSLPMGSAQADTTLPNSVVLRASWVVSEPVVDKLKQVDLTVRSLPKFPGGYERAVRLFIVNRDPP
ncbi:MAG: prepilin-type N-terminal cleavage/methylation domain-containing protein [Gemmatimonadetes bacterium]|nr:prepilin-type N-terminal cleavage/methylation domain-containing protein [Gemmatimonadota bacterium]